MPLLKLQQEVLRVTVGSWRLRVAPCLQMGPQQPPEVQLSGNAATLLKPGREGTRTKGKGSSDYNLYVLSEILVTLGISMLPAAWEVGCFCEGCELIS